MTAPVPAPAELVKPRLRGVSHRYAFFVSIVFAALIIAAAPSGLATFGVVVYGVTMVGMFGASALYHRGNWSPRWSGVLKRLDHSNIFLIIAGTYTPFAVILLRHDGGTALLWIVWAAALGGIAFRVLWVGAPRWLYTPVYLALGWVAVFYLGALLHTGGAAVVTLLAIGGGLYSAGGVVYATKKPNPSPRWFGFHEVFHALTLAAYAVHYIAISLATYRA